MSGTKNIWMIEVYDMYLKVFISALLAAISSFTSFGLNVGIARALGLDFFAEFSFVMSLTTIISVFASIGLNQYLLLKAPILSVSELRNSFGKIFNTVTLTFIPFSIGIIFFLLIRGSELLTVFSVTGIAYLLTLLLMVQAIYISIKKIHIYQVFDKISRNFILITFILISILLPLTYDFSYFILFVFITYLFSVLSLLYKSKENFKIEPKYGFLEPKLVKAGAPLYLVFISVTLIGNLDIIILDVLSDSHGVAVFSASQKIALLAGFIVNAVANVLIPYFVKANDNCEADTMDKHIRTSTKLGFYSILAFFIFCIFFGEFLLGIFGSIYSEGYFILLLLIGNSLLSSMYGQTLTLMKVKNDGKLLAKYILISLLIKISLIPLLFNYYGVMGVVISSIACTFIWNQLSYLYLKRKYGIDTFIYKWKR